ncbi:hypothetical protein M9H77_24348 [Catharanthus roseus]|uniref:Uncharacterized protein n=1 Tax=Catharanthus roseus TaxID=4058 RepID=A0ACC0AXE1_CATRO|nr:hypothetical protein M9H77_24348 [Catharanthus roseus]
MVRPSGRRGDDDLGPVTDRIGRVERRTVTASSRGFSWSTHGYSHAEYSVSSSVPVLMYRGLQIGYSVPVAHVAYASGPDRRPRHGKGKMLTCSFMSVMSKIAGSHNKRPKVAREVPALTQKRKKVKPSDWEQTKPAEGSPVDPKLIPSYSGHVAGPLWHRQDLMQRSFTLLPLVDRLHCRLVSRLPTIYSTSWIAHSSVIRVANIVPARLCLFCTFACCHLLSF